MRNLCPVYSSGRSNLMLLTPLLTSSMTVLSLLAVLLEWRISR
jgi:hypothetical protein